MNPYAARNIPTNLFLQSEGSHGVSVGLSASVVVSARECAWCQGKCSGEHLEGISQAGGRDDFPEVRLWDQGCCFNASALFLQAQII